MSEWIKMTPSLESGLKNVDQLENGKFRALVNRLCSTLRLGHDGKIFNQEEEEKLLASLGVNKATLSSILQTIDLIYLQAGYAVVKPTAMESLMKSTFPISEEKISIFTNAWISHGKGIVECLRHKSIFPIQVDDVNWNLHVQSASSALSQEANPLVLLQLGLTGPEANSKLTVEMDKNDLTSLYDKLERIQGQLDLILEKKLDLTSHN